LDSKALAQFIAASGEALQFSILEPNSDWRMILREYLNISVDQLIVENGLKYMIDVRVVISMMVLCSANVEED